MWHDRERTKETNEVKLSETATERLKRCDWDEMKSWDGNFRDAKSFVRYALCDMIYFWLNFKRKSVLSVLAGLPVWARKKSFTHKTNYKDCCSEAAAVASLWSYEVDCSANSYVFFYYYYFVSQKMTEIFCRLTPKKKTTTQILFS